VKKGQLLFEIDPRPFKAALDKPKGSWAGQARSPTLRRASRTGSMSTVHPWRESKPPAAGLDNAIQKRPGG